MKTFKNILEEVATEDDDDTAGPKESDADAYRSHMTDPGASSLLGNDHVRMSTLIKENNLTSFSTDFTLSGTYFVAIFREHPFNHGPAKTQSLAHEDGIDCEVYDEEEASGASPDHGVGEGENPQPSHLPRQEEHCHRDVKTRHLDKYRLFQLHGISDFVTMQQCI